MTIKRDPSGRRSIQVEVEVPGTPEEVWEAIATGPGISSWFYPTDVEPQVGGVLEYHTGSKMDVPATVTVWDPPHRFSHEGKDCGPDGPPTATEWTIESRAGGRCLVRVVHSLFASTDDWDDQLENFEAGWPVCFAVLRPYLAHFGGQRASIIRAMGRRRRFGARCLERPARRARGRWTLAGRALGLRRFGCGLRGGRRRIPVRAPALYRFPPRPARAGNRRGKHLQDRSAGNRDAQHLLLRR